MCWNLNNPSHAESRPGAGDLVSLCATDVMIRALSGSLSGWCQQVQIGCLMQSRTAFCHFPGSASEEVLVVGRLSCCLVVVGFEQQEAWPNLKERLEEQLGLPKDGLHFLLIGY